MDECLSWIDVDGPMGQKMIVVINGGWRTSGGPNSRGARQNGDNNPNPKMGLMSGQKFHIAHFV